MKDYDFKWIKDKELREKYVEGNWKEDWYAQEVDEVNMLKNVVYILSFMLVLEITLITLKLLNIITYSWLIILIPIWILLTGILLWLLLKLVVTMGMEWL